MLRRFAAIAVCAFAASVFGQSASADPVNAKKSARATALCGTQEVQVALNGNGIWTPGHVIGSTAMFIPTAFNLTFTFTPTGGAPQTETLTAAKQHQPKNVVTCELPTALNTDTTPQGTATLSGTATGFFTPAH
jgi:hypothetical protein